MIARVHSAMLQGIDALACEVEADVAMGDSGEVKLVGMAETSVRESVSRIQAALRNSNFRWPGPKVTINLAPADVRKDSAAFDLPIAVAAALAGNLFQSTIADQYLLAGELALDGRVRPIRGALAMAMLAASQGKRGIVLPVENTAEAAVVAGLDVIPVDSFAQAAAFLTGELLLEPRHVDLDEIFATAGKYDVDFADVRGQESAKRALTVAAAGHHNILLIGPPGSGKTMLAKRLPTVLPPLTPEESLETTRVYSARGLLAPGQSLMAVRPVRTPHHSSSAAALIGGGIIPQPGEVSLAHHGVLFLDEFPEFARPTLEMIRQPLEDRVVTIPRVHSTLKFPASIMLVAAMNPCPCGYFTDPTRKCKCSSFQVERYMGQLSGPLIDRIDIHVEVPPVPYQQLRATGATADGLSSEQMRDQVQRAREIQRQRFSACDASHNIAHNATNDTAENHNDTAVHRDTGEPPTADRTPAGTAHAGTTQAGTAQPGRPSPSRPQAGFFPDVETDDAPPPAPHADGDASESPTARHASTAPADASSRRTTTTNATMSPRQVRQFCKLDAAGEVLLKQAMTELGLSARAHDKVLRVARTIADMEGAETIQPHHLAEAIQYRRLDRRF